LFIAISNLSCLNTRHYIEGLLAAFLFGCTPVFIKKVSANAFTIGIVRLLIASILVYVLFVGYKRLKSLSKKDWASLAIIGLVFGLHWVTYFTAVKTATPSLAILGVSSFGIYLLLFDWIIHKKKPKLFDWAMIALAAAGILLIVPEFTLGNNQTIGVLIALVSAFFFAMLPILQQKNKHIYSYTRAWGQYSFGLIFFTFFLSETEWDLPKSDWGYLGLLAILCTLGAHTLWLRATTNLPNTSSGLIYYLSIPVAMIVSFIFLDESMPAKKILGAILIVLSNVVAVIQQMRRNRAAKKSLNLAK
jgi:drug/metabolite transporter (DMT)-like permease